MAPKISRCSRKEIGWLLYRSSCIDGSHYVLENRNSDIREIFVCGIRKILLVECGILGFGTRNAAQAQGIWNPTNDWNPESKFH